MKIQYFSLILAVVCLIGCKNTPAPKFSDVAGKEWKLVEVRLDNKEIIFDRDMLTNEAFGDIFTLNFDAENVSGRGAPNRFSAPFTLGNNQAINISPMRSTMMAAVSQPEKLREHDFFIYMQNAYEWKLLENGNLELNSKAEDDKNVRLIFGLF